jgi:sugar-specific transcriptional regulator TrmB
MYQDLLAQTGLTPNQATIYELLLQEGPSKASKISQKSPLKRGLVYKILDELVLLKLAKIETKPGAVALFTAEHPNGLRELVKTKEAEVERAKTGIEQLLPQLTSEFNLAVGKPGIKFYEGLEGAKEVIFDSLKATGTIYTYMDAEAIDKHLKKVNESYIKQRAEKEIPKKIIALDTPFARAHYQKLTSPLTEVRLIPLELNPFKTGMQIYNNTISYSTLTDKKMIGVIIEDANIAQMHRSLFEYLWSVLPKFSASAEQTS